MQTSTLTINGTAQNIREYNGQRVVTLRDVDTVHSRKDGTARKNFRMNRKHFVEGMDFYLPKGMGLKVPCRCTGLDDVKASLASPKGIVLLTESGYLMLVKSFTDDLAWKVQRELVNNYFKVQPPKAEPETPPLFAPNALATVKPPKRKARQVVDIPRNQEAQRLIKEICDTATALNIVLENYNQYLEPKSVEHYTLVIQDLCIKATVACSSLRKVRLNEIDEPK